MEGAVDSEIPIKYLSIGLWNKKRNLGSNLNALILRSTQQLVFLVDTTATPQVVRRGYKRYLRHLTAGSPFRSSQSDLGCVLTFEVDFKNIGGIDYSNPLCLPGRLVLESKSVVRREFPTREDADAFYRPQKRRPLHSLSYKSPSTKQKRHSLPNGDFMPRSLPSPWQSPSPSPGPKFKLGHSEEKRSSTRRRGSETGSNFASRQNSPAPNNRRKTLGEYTPVERKSRLSDFHDQDHSKRKWRESMDDAQEDFQDSATSSLTRDFGFKGQSGLRTPNFEDTSNPVQEQKAKLIPAMFKYCTITFNFDDPSVPAALKPWIEKDEKLLKLYESGLPAWAIYAPQYGIWYRPWMRSVTYMLFIFISSFSLVMGFYDLYKNVPYLDQLLRQYASFPLAVIMQWLDEHLSFRLSILFAYLFGKSELAVSLLRYLGTLGAMTKEALQPLIIILGPAFNGWMSSVKECSSAISSIASPLYNSVALGLNAAILQPLYSLGILLYTSLLPILQAFSYIGTSLVFGPLMAIQTASIGLLSILNSAREFFVWIGAIFAGFGQAFRAGANVAPEVAQSAQTVGSQVSWLYAAIRIEALEVVRTSFMKVVRALQTLSRLCAHWGTRIARHRLTLELRFRRQRQKAQLRLKQCMPLWLVSIFRWMLIDRDKLKRDSDNSPRQENTESKEPQETSQTRRDGIGTQQPGAYSPTKLANNFKSHSQ